MANVQLINQRYELHEIIGRGGMGSVYRATDRLTREFVAFKQVYVPPQQSELADSNDTERTANKHEIALAREFKVLASLRHPNIISVLDYGFDDEHVPFFTMQFLEEAEPIDRAVKTGEDVIYVLLQILLALSYLHRRGVVHRDLKPANIMMDADYHVKVLDFGLVLDYHNQPEPTKERMAGTTSYMAPELFQQEPWSTTSDLYAVGVIAYRLILGNTPFKADSPEHLMHKIVYDDPDLDRIPHDVYGFISTLLKKDPKKRYQTADEAIRALCEATATPLPAETDALRESFLQAMTFVGREQEIDRLQAAMYAGIRGMGSIWLLGGESGVGKSRLVDELRILALVKGVLVLRGQATSRSNKSYEVWRDIMRQLVVSVDLLDLEASVLKEIVPNIGGLLGRDVPDAPHLADTSHQHRLILTMQEVIKRYHDPMVILLEDLQWAHESLMLLKYLSSYIHTLPVFIVGTFRNDERPTLPQELPELEYMTLDRLSNPAIAELAKSMLGDAGANREVVELLQRETEGNAFFLVETVRALAEESGRLNEIGKFELPDKVITGGVQSIIQRRLNRVPEWGQELLRLSAVIGRRIDLELLHYDCDGCLGDRSIENWIFACANAAVLDSSGNHWRFAHDKLREELLNNLSDDERMSFHRRAALAIETVYLEDVHYVTSLAYHWRRAGDIDREIYYAFQAAEEANRLGDSDDVLRFAKRILGAGQELSPDLHVELLGLMGQARVALGHYTIAEIIFDQQLDLAHNCVHITGILIASLGLSEVHLQHGNYDRARRLAEHARDIAQRWDASRELAQSLEMMANIRMAQGGYEVAWEFLQKSLVINEQLDHQQAIANNLTGFGALCDSLGQYENAIEYYDRAMAIFEEVGNQREIADTLNSLGVVHDLNGSPDIAERCFTHSLHLADRIGFRSGKAKSLSNLGVLLYRDYQDYEKALKYQSEAIFLFRELDERAQVTIGLGEVVRTALKLGDVAQARFALRDAMSLADDINSEALILNVIARAAELALHTWHMSQAVEWFSLVYNHPSTDQKVRDDIDRMKAELEQLLEPGQYALIVEISPPSDAPVDLYEIMKMIEETLLN